MSGKDKAVELDEALARILSRAEAVTEPEVLSLLECSGRVLAEDVLAPINVPGVANSAMDGYAIRYAELAGAETESEAKFGTKSAAETGVELPVALRVAAGAQVLSLSPGSAARIFTGAPVPEGADTVVIQEECVAVSDGEGGERVRLPLQAAVKKGSNVRLAGEDLAQGAVALAKGSRIGPQAVGLAASLGVAELPVYRRLKVALFSTGDELREPGQALAHGGQIYNSNRYLLTALLQRMGVEVLDLGAVPDNPEQTRAALQQAAGQADAMVSTGGASVGDEDHLKDALRVLGELELWKVKIKPGKPVVFGRVEGVPLIGLPGNPVSAFVTFLLFARPFLSLLQGQSVPAKLWSCSLPAAFTKAKASKRREFLRARAEPDEDGRLKVTLYPNQGSGVLSSTAWATGLVDMPPGVTIQPGDLVVYIPFDGVLS